MTLTSSTVLDEGSRRAPIAAPSVTPYRGSAFLRYLLFGLDAAALGAAWMIAIAWSPIHDRSLPMAAVAALSLTVGQLAVFSALGLYRARVCHLRTVEYTRIARGCLIVVLCALVFDSAVGTMVSPWDLAFGGALGFVFVTILRGGYRTWLSDRRRLGHNLRTVLLVGTGDEAAEITALLTEHPELGYRCAGFVGSKRAASKHRLGGAWLGDLDDALTVLAETGVTGVIICASDLRPTELNEVLQELLAAGVHVQLSSGLHGVDVGRLRPSPLAHEPLFYVEPVTLAAWQLATKRVIDFTLAAVMLFLTSPVLALAALGIKLQDRGPIFFKQLRVGREGKPFVLYKLRTMREGAETELADLCDLNAREGPLTKLPQDPRVTTLGRLLRVTSIDELPQLWNVLNGTMSLVGPRPALPDEVIQFDAELRARESVWPGITGLWQVEGRDNPSFAAYRRFDLFYLQNWSVALDIVILLGTVESVIGRIFRGLLHLDQDIQVAPPEVRDPGREASRARRHTSRTPRPTLATRTKTRKEAGVR